MTLERFIATRSGSWRELDDLVSAAGNRPHDLGAARVRRLAELYREASADLALARRRYGSDPIRIQLEDLVRRAGVLVYAAAPAERTVGSFFARDYWRAVAERPTALAAAWLAMLLPALLAAGWAHSDPAAAANFIPAAFQGAIDPPTDSGIGAAGRAVFTAELFTNNIQVTFIAFAAGIAFGVGTLLVLAFNGLLLGAVIGAAIAAGNGAALVSFLIPHGPLELSCIAVTAAAGLRLGWSLVDPGDRTRGAALTQEARRAVLIVLGTMPFLVLAGVIEAFIRSAALPEPILFGVGVGAFVGYWALVWRLGRRSDRPHPKLRVAPAVSG